MMQKYYMLKQTMAKKINFFSEKKLLLLLNKISLMRQKLGMNMLSRIHIHIINILNR